MYENSCKNLFDVNPDSKNEVLLSHEFPQALRDKI